MVQAGEFLEYANVFGKHRYGTPRKWLDKAREQGSDLVLEIDVQGAVQIRKAVPGAVSISHKSAIARSFGKPHHRPRPGFEGRKCSAFAARSRTR